MDFTPLRISTVKPQKELSFDLYIYFKDQYLCYSKRGEMLTDEKYQKLKIQKIAKFFITEEDEINYQNFLDQLLNESLSNPDVNIEAKVNIVEGAATSAIERMQQDPTSESAFKMTNSAAKSLRMMIKNNPETLKKIFGKKADKNEEIIKHSLNVCVLSVRLGEILKCNEQELDDLACAALIHDVSLAAMPEEARVLFFKQKKEYNNDDKKNYYLHCKNAVSMLQEKPYVNKTILDLIANHEEVLSGSGPNKKRKLTKLEEILSLVNNYDKRAITEGSSPGQTLKDMMIDELGNYDLDLLNEFKKVLHAEGLLELENNSN
jgi:HD-GYP domain-containing protein (c-di-GMP phosphodiesterase class II)